MVKLEQQFQEVLNETLRGASYSEEKANDGSPRESNDAGSDILGKRRRNGGSEKDNMDWNVGSFLL